VRVIFCVFVALLKLKISLYSVYTSSDNFVSAFTQDLHFLLIQPTPIIVAKHIEYVTAYGCHPTCLSVETENS